MWYRLSRRLTAVLLLLILAVLPLRGQQSSEEVTPGEAGGRTQEKPLPSSRTERLRQLREERRGEIEPPPADNAIQKYLKNFDQKGNQSVEDANFWGFYPRLDWIARGSGVAPGARYWNPDVAGPIDIMGSGFYSWRHYQLYDFQVGLIPTRGKKIPPRKFETESIEELGDFRQEEFSRFKLYGSVRWRDRTDDPFYGSGPDSLKANRARYRIKDSLAELVTGFQFTRRVGYTFRAGFLGNVLASPRGSPPVSEVFPPEELPGLAAPPNYFTVRNSFLLDFRDHPGIPHRGAFVSFAWEKFDNTTGTNLFNFNRFGADLRGYIPIRTRQQVIALRGFFVNSDPGPGNQVPFFLQPSLGGGESLRGYDTYRFQGDKLMLLQAEYRWEASRMFELALFGDTGTVASQGHRLSLDKLKSDLGFGFRVKSTEAVLFRLDIARGNEGTKLQFRFSQAF